MAGVGEFDTSGMLALLPTEADAQRLAMPGGLDPDDLHVTLAFLGDDLDQWPAERRAAVVTAGREVAEQYGPISATVPGPGVLGRDEPAAVYLINMPQPGVDLRTAVAEHDIGTFATWIPHLTVRNNHGDVSDLSHRGPVTFDRLRVALGDDHTDIPLSGVTVDLDEPAGEPSPADTETKDPDRPAGRWSGPDVAGLALVAADTGRVLMLQRAHDPTGEDPAGGTWEFPGGHRETGDGTSLDAAIREWSEEVGQPVPDGGDAADSWTSPDGVYRGHVVVIPRESLLDLAGERTVHNPDDDSEQVAWWDPDDAKRNPALRREVRRTPWAKLTRAVEHARAAADAGTKDGSGGYSPPQGVQTAAKRALQLISAGKAGQGFTDTGRKRAQDLARGASVSGETVKRMKAYFDRHQSDRGHHWGKAGAETPGYVAWLAWGGDAGYAWARKITGQMEKGDPMDVEVKAPVANTGAPQASARTLAGSGAAPSTQGDKSKGKGKRKVASKAGESRYGLPIGTELGQARDANAKKAQDDKGAQGLYDQLRKADPAKYGELLGKMNADDLQKLSRLLYSSRSSNPAIVKARIAVANALRKKGIDVNTAGGLGRPGAKPAARGRSGKAGDRIKGNAVDANKIDDATRDRLLAEGWRGRPDDGAERLYRPGTKGADEMGTEVKAATTSSASEKRKAENAGKTIKDEDGEDAWPIRTIGDVAAALKKAKAIKDPDRKKKVMGHIRTGAGKIKAGHMVPKSDDADKGTGKGSGSGSGPPEFIKKKINKKSGELAGIEYSGLDEYAEWIQRKVMSPDPAATKLREWWAHGEGRAKWMPGTPGDFERLKRAARKYIPARMLNGWVANVHKLATGEWPGKNAHGKKSLEAGWGYDADEITISGDEVKAALALTDPASDPSDPLYGDDAVSLSLDSYADMADMISTEDEYAQALADQVVWDALPDGTLTPSDAEPERGDARPDAGDDDTPFDASGLLDEMESVMS